MKSRTLIQIGFLAMLTLATACGGGQKSAPITTEPALQVTPTALFRAAASGQVDSVSRLIALGADVNQNLGTSQDQLTPLMAAVINNHAEVADLLLRGGAKIRPLFRGYSIKDVALFLNNDQIIRSIANSRSKK